MAFKKRENHETGIILAEAYHRVENVIITPSSHRSPIAHVSIGLASYANESVRRENKPAFSRRNFTVSQLVENKTSGQFEPNPAYQQFFALSVLEAEGMNLLKAAYLCLKSISAFEDAIDV